MTTTEPKVSPFLYICTACSGPIGMDERSRVVRLELSEPRPYADLLVALDLERDPAHHWTLPRDLVFGVLCRKCSDRVAKLVESMRSTVLARTGQSS